MKPRGRKERTMILSSGRCAWAKCNYCGYGNLEEKRLGHEELKQQIDNYFRSIDRGTDVLRVYVSGNVTDRAQVPVETQRYLVEKCREWQINTLLVESLPQFISEKTLEPYKQKDIHMVFAIGLECYNDELRERLKKGFDREMFERSCELIRERGWDVKVYLLVNPPFVEDYGSVKESVDRSVEYALEWADEITLINCQPHKKTELYDMFKEGDWEPLDKAEFFDVVKEHIANDKIRYDATQYSPFPSWKSWLPQFEEKTPIKGVGKEQLMHPAYERWQKFLCERYEHPEEKDVVLFVPCSHTKPYVNGPLHKAMKRALNEIPGKERIHLVVISSPGVIPIEFSRYYPFDSYDWPPWEETEEIKELYTRVTKERVKNYLEAHDYDAHYCYFRENAESLEALEEACEVLDINVTRCLTNETWCDIRDEKNPLAQKPALEDLSRALNVI